MIIRVFEAQLKSGSEQDFMAGERSLLGRTDIDGLLSASVGRRLGSGGTTHVITLSLWRDEAALRNFTPDWSRPVFIAGHEGFVESWTIRHFEAIDLPDPA
jgi:heme-degrading monooxygenase HmoA